MSGSGATRADSASDALPSEPPSVRPWTLRDTSGWTVLLWSVFVLLGVVDVVAARDLRQVLAVVLGILLLVAGVIGLVDAFRSCTVVTPLGVVVRHLFRTERIPRSDISDVAVAYRGNTSPNVPTMDPEGRPMDDRRSILVPVLIRGDRPPVELAGVYRTDQFDLGSLVRRLRGYLDLPDATPVTYVRSHEARSAGQVVRTLLLRPLHAGVLLLVAVLCSFGVRLPFTVLPTGDGVRVVPAPLGTEPYTSPYGSGGEGDSAWALTRPVAAPKQVTIAVTDGSSGDQVPVIEGPDFAITNHRRTPVVLSCSFARIGSHRPPTVVDLIGPTNPGQTYHFWSAPMGSPGTAGRYDVTCVDQGTG